MTVGQRRFVAIQPIAEWPQKKVSGVKSPFRAGFTDTLDMLERELSHLGASEPTLLTLHDPDDVRLDGRLKTDTRRPTYQGVVLEFKRAARPHETKCAHCRSGVGRFWTQAADKSRSAYAHKVADRAVWCDDQKPEPVTFRFPADKYSDWRDNVRAIAMVLEGLRMIERHGVKSEAQYAGYKALPGAGATAHGLNVGDAVLILRQHSGIHLDDGSNLSREAVERAYREAARKTHPDAGGSTADFARVNDAVRVLRAHLKV